VAIERTVSSEASTLLLCARVLPGREAEFAQWHVRGQSAVLASQGALSVEFWPPAPPDQLETVVVNRFASVDALQQWRRGDRNRELIAEAAPLVEGGLVMQLVGQAAVEYSVRHGVTMVMVTEIKPGKEAAYRAWADRIQKLQATFPGYIGSFVQPPQYKECGWTTVLRFDSAANLDRWIKSKERAAMVKESEDLVADFHAQRVDTSFPGWVANDPTTGKPPNLWKTAGLVLLTLFPVIMLELRFLNPHLATLNPAVRTFIGNAISVAVTTWPLMPLAIWGFHAWLFPENKPRWLVLTMPIVLVLCYVIEIAVLWHLLF
jgi:antibiotic biosynthesis monooxygenase (ABM) superfamily enzyme